MNLARTQVVVALLAALGWMVVGGIGLGETPAPGTTVHVAAGTPLMRGTQVVATVPSDQDLKVLKTEGPWVGVAVEVNGSKRGGWVLRSGGDAGSRTAMQYRQRFSYTPEASGQPAPAYQYSRPNYFTGRRSTSEIYALPKTDSRRFGTR